MATTTDGTKVERERIVTRCPACGHQTLFIGSGGHLTCGWIPCRAPSVGDVVDDLKARAATADLWPKLSAFVDSGLSVVADPHGILGSPVERLLFAEGLLKAVKQVADRNAEVSR